MIFTLQTSGGKEKEEFMKRGLGLSKGEPPSSNLLGLCDFDQGLFHLSWEFL